MDRNDRLCPRRYRRGDGLGIHRQRAIVDVDEYRRRADVDDGGRRGDERERYGDDFIPGPDVGGEEREVKRARPRVQRDGVRHAAVVGELTFERGNLLAEDELPRFEHPRDRGVNLGLDAVVLGPEVDERNHTGLSAGTSSRLGRAAIGILQPVPNARSVTFNPGAACLRLNSAMRTRRSTRRTVVGSNPAATISLALWWRSMWRCRMSSRTS